MKRTIILIGMAISLSITSFAQALKHSWPDSISIPQEQFKVKQRLVTGSVCLFAGGGLLYLNNQVRRDNIQTQLHPDNFAFPGYSLVGFGIAAFVSSWLRWQKVNLLIDERGVGIVLRL